VVIGLNQATKRATFTCKKADKKLSESVLIGPPMGCNQVRKVPPGLADRDRYCVTRISLKSKSVFRLG